MMFSLEGKADVIFAENAKPSAGRKKKLHHVPVFGGQIKSERTRKKKIKCEESELKLIRHKDIRISLSFTSQCLLFSRMQMACTFRE